MEIAVSPSWSQIQQKYKTPISSSFPGPSFEQSSFEKPPFRSCRPCPYLPLLSRRQKCVFPHDGTTSCFFPFFSLGCSISFFPPFFYLLVPLIRLTVNRPILILTLRQPQTDACQPPPPGTVISPSPSSYPPACPIPPCFSPQSIWSHQLSGFALSPLLQSNAWG